MIECIIGSQDFNDHVAKKFLANPSDLTNSTVICLACMTEISIASKPKPDTKVFFSVHNDMVIDGQLQFIERSYYIPSEILPKLYELLEPYETGTFNLILVDQ